MSKAKAIQGVSVTTVEFRKALATVVAFREPRHHAAPYLAFFGLKVANGKATASYYGLDATAHAKPVPASGSGEALLSIDAVSSFLGAADADEIEIQEKSGRVHLRSGDLACSLIPFQSKDGAPPIAVPERSNRPTVLLAEGVLTWLLGLTLPFASNDETRYYLNGVAFEVQDGIMHAVGTDGHRLGHRQTSCPSLPDMDSRILPYALAATLAKIAKDREADVLFSDTHVRVHVRDTVTVTAKLIDGKYPDWRRVVPEAHRLGASAEIEAHKLTRFLKAGRGIAQGHQALRIAIQDGKATASIENPDAGSITLPLATGVDDADCTRGLNAKYAGEIAKALGSRRLRFDLERGETGAPMVIRNPEAKAEEFVVLMPMRV